MDLFLKLLPTASFTTLEGGRLGSFLRYLSSTTNGQTSRSHLVGSSKCAESFRPLSIVCVCLMSFIYAMDAADITPFRSHFSTAGTKTTLDRTPN